MDSQKSELRTCADCGASIEDRRGNAKRCLSCVEVKTLKDARVWHWANRQNVLARKAAWRKANASKTKGRHRPYTANMVVTQRRWRAKHREIINARKAVYRKANAEKLLAYQRTYNAAYPEKHRSYDHARRARKRNMPCEAIIDLEVFERDGWTCGICSKAIDPALRHPVPLSASLDHVVPLSRGGPHLYSNVQASHLRCNLSKHNRMPDGYQMLLIGS